MRNCWARPDSGPMLVHLSDILLFPLLNNKYKLKFVSFLGHLWLTLPFNDETSWASRSSSIFFYNGPLIKGWAISPEITLAVLLSEDPIYWVSFLHTWDRGFSRPKTWWAIHLCIGCQIYVFVSGLYLLVCALICLRLGGKKKNTA